MRARLLQILGQVGRPGLQLPSLPLLLLQEAQELRVLVGQHLDLLVLARRVLLGAPVGGLGRSGLALELKVLVPQRPVLLLHRQLVRLRLVGLLLHRVKLLQQLRVLVGQDPQLLVLHANGLLRPRLARRRRCRRALAAPRGRRLAARTRRREPCPNDHGSAARLASLRRGGHGKNKVTETVYLRDALHARRCRRRAQDAVWADGMGGLAAGPGARRRRRWPIQGWIQHSLTSAPARQLPLPGRRPVPPSTAPAPAGRGGHGLRVTACPLSCQRKPGPRACRGAACSAPTATWASVRGTRCKTMGSRRARAWGPGPWRSCGTSSAQSCWPASAAR